VAETVLGVTLGKKFCEDKWGFKGDRGNKETRKAKKLYYGKRT
jgi:hypothetical protein